MKRFSLLVVLLLLWFTFAVEDFPKFPLILYWEIMSQQPYLQQWNLIVCEKHTKTVLGSVRYSWWNFWYGGADWEHLIINEFDTVEWDIEFRVYADWRRWVAWPSLTNWIYDDNCRNMIIEHWLYTWAICRMGLHFYEDKKTTFGDWINDCWWSIDSWSIWWNWWGWWGWWGGWWWGWGWWGGGGGWWWDIPTNNTTTNSWTENTWNNSIVESWNTIENQTNNNLNPQEVLSNWYTRELNDAYIFAFKNGITTMKTIDQANMNWSLNRIAMAKMLSQYAINILKKKPDTSKKCNFTDVTAQMDSDYSNWVTLACQLWIMWVWITEFRPNDTVIRAEFGTALSRMLFNLSDWTDKYYSIHLAKLKREKIISNDDPTLKELRWYVMLMLMRSAK